MPLLIQRNSRTFLATVFRFLPSHREDLPPSRPTSKSRYRLEGIPWPRWGGSASPNDPRGLCREGLNTATGTFKSIFRRSSTKVCGTSHALTVADGSLQGSLTLVRGFLGLVQTNGRGDGRSGEVLPDPVFARPSPRFALLEIRSELEDRTWSQRRRSVTQTSPVPTPLLEPPGGFGPEGLGGGLKPLQGQSKGELRGPQFCTSLTVPPAPAARPGARAWLSSRLTVGAARPQEAATLSPRPCPRDPRSGPPPVQAPGTRAAGAVLQAGARTGVPLPGRAAGPATRLAALSSRLRLGAPRVRHRGYLAMFPLPRPRSAPRVGEGKRVAAPPVPILSRTVLSPIRLG